MVKNLEHVFYIVNRTGRIFKDKQTGNVYHEALGGGTEGVFKHLVYLEYSAYKNPQYFYLLDFEEIYISDSEARKRLYSMKICSN